MPNWKTHIEIGKRINKYLNYQNDDYEIFLFATISPDINNSYLMNKVSAYIPHDITHLKDMKGITYQRFYQKYQNELNNKEPEFWGYLLHLYIDYYWNQQYYNKVKHTSGKKENASKLKEIKHNDFNVFNNKFINDKLEISNLDRLYTKLKNIEEIKITKKDILYVLDYLNNQKKSNEELKFYKIQELTKLFNSSIKDFNNEFLK